VDLYESGPGSPQVHDFNGGILPNGLFWTVDVPRWGFRADLERGSARLELRGLPQIDSFQFGSVFSTPATVDISVTWEATGPPRRRGSGNAVPADDPAAFLGLFRRARARGTFAGAELGFAFETRGEATSRLGFAQLGFERNGVFLD
jgi:hypothetical protein